MSRTRRSLLIVGGVLIAWFLCTIVFWGVRPLSDSVPIGIDQSLLCDDGVNRCPKQVSETVECNSLFDSSARDTSKALPVLNVQPEGFAELTYSRSACGAVQRDARIVFGLNTVFVLVALAGVVLVARRTSAHAEPPLMKPLLTA